MSLMPLEIVFIVGDQAYHLTRAALDLALLGDACVYGVHTVEAFVRVVAGLCMLTFHALFLGPRSSLTSDAAMFFGDLLYHFFHMLLSTWRLLLILWTVQPREFLILIVLWVDFFFHVAVVWLYSGGIQVTVRMQFVDGPADAPRPPPQPPQPPPPPAELFAVGPDIMGPVGTRPILTPVGPAAQTADASRDAAASNEQSPGPSPPGAAVSSAVLSCNVPVRPPATISPSLLASAVTSSLPLPMPA
ncbi:hypothetical protein ISCGN_027573 [Ixodes scapularis]